MRSATLHILLLLLATPAVAGDAVVSAADRLVDALSAPTPTVRCLQPLLLEIHGHEDTLPPGLRQRLEAHLAPSKVPALTHISPSGRFELAYVLDGANAVPALDADTNGVPDFVERIAVYCDESWAHQVDELGFAAPDVGAGRYQVSFEAMGAYGYTTPSGAVQTRMVLHNTFEGFGPNDDPEGDRWGAAKVTVAHEFKHATQFAASYWSEGGWLELDATWVEESQYDEVNDYVSWLAAGSPIAEPGLPLDDGGSGSYEDCVWQHYLAARFGVDLLLDLWAHRATLPVESMVDSYDHVLTRRGSSFEEAFCGFAAWNLATGTRAVDGFGYEEAATYPTAPLHGDWTTLPVDADGTVAGLAADLLRVVPSGRRGTLELDFARQPGSDLRLAALVRTVDGATHLRTWNAPDAVGALDIPLEDIAEIGLAVSNPIPGAPAGWSLDVREVLAPARPQLALDLPTPDLTLAPDTRRTLPVLVTNAGEAGSLLDHRVVAMEPLPPRAAASVAGSTVSMFPSDFVPGTTADYEVVVTNASADEEWLASVTIELPEGVTLVDATPLTGGHDGDLEPVASEGAIVWSDPDGGFGRVRGGEQARGSVTLAFASTLPGELVLTTQVTGDGWGSGPHTEDGTWTLTGPEMPTLALDPLDPYLPLDAPVRVSWTGTATDVVLEWSPDGGATWDVLTHAAGPGHWDWTPKGAPTAEARLRVRQDGGAAKALSPPLALYRPVAWIGSAAGTVPAGGTLRHDLTVDVSSLWLGSHPVDLAVLHGGTASVRRVTIRVEESVALPPLLAQNAPNPFNPSTTLRWHLPEAGPVSLVVYDLAGRRVATLVDSTQPAGDGAVTWHGTDDRGHPVASGAYLYRLTTSTDAQTRRMVLVR